jgi:hypothetical protein
MFGDAMRVLPDCTIAGTSNGSQMSGRLPASGASFYQLVLFEWERHLPHGCVPRHLRAQLKRYVQHRMHNS